MAFAAYTLGVMLTNRSMHPPPLPITAPEFHLPHCPSPPSLSTLLKKNKQNHSQAADGIWIEPPLQREKGLRREGGISLLAYVKGVAPPLIPL